MGQFDDAISRALARRQQGSASPSSTAAEASTPPPDPALSSSSGELDQAIGRHLGQDVLERQVPPQRVPHPEQAENDFIQAARNNYALATPGPAASAKAVAVADRIRAKPDDIPSDPSLGEEAMLALNPTQVRGDARPKTAAQTAKYAAQRALQTVVETTLTPVDPLRLIPVLNRARDAVTPDVEKGLPTENEVMWALRVFGTAVPAAIQETVERLPSPDVTGAVRAASDGAFADAATRFFTPSSVGQQVLGVEPGELQRVHRDTAAADWAEGVLERIEGGKGLEEDFARSALNRLGPDHPYLNDAAWWLGLGVDALTDWEGSLVKGGHLVTEVARKASALRELDPAMKLGPAVWDALRNNHVDSDWIGNKVASALEAGGSIDDVPGPIRARMEEVALLRGDEPLVELTERTGVGKARTTQAEDLAHQAELEGARAEAADAMAARRREVRPELSEATKERPRLPEFRTQPSTAAQFWEQAGKLFAKGEYPAGGYNIPRHEGFRRLRGAEQMTIDRKTYVLRNFRGDVIAQGDYADVLEKQLRRMKAELRRTGTQKGKTADVWARNSTIFKDEIWDGNTRPVARWSRSGRMRLVTDYHMASDVEERLAANLRTNDLRALPGRFLADERVRARKAAATAGEMVGDATTGAPGGKPPLSEVGQVAVEATRLALRDMLGSHELKQLPNLGFVARSDHARMLRQAGEILGVSPERAQKLVAGATTTVEEEGKLAALAARAGVERQPGTLTTKGWALLRRAAFEQAGGALADVRFRVRGTQPWVDKLWGALSDAHLDRRKYGRVAQAVLTRGPLAFLSRAFLEDKFGSLPSPVRVLLKEASVRLGRVADDVLADFKALPKDGTLASKVQQLVGRYAIVHPDELELATRAVVDSQAVNDLRKTWRGDRPRWLDSEDPMVLSSGFRGWSNGVKDGAADAGRAWVRSHLFAANAPEVLPDLLKTSIPEDVAIGVWREAFQEGQLEGPMLHEALRSVNRGAVKLNPEGALIAHVLELKAQVVVAEMVDKLMGAGFVVHGSDVRKRALDAVMLGEHKRWNPDAKRWEFRYPEAEVTWALGKARDWGIDPGSGAELKDAKLGGQAVVLPKYIADDLQRMVASASVDSRGIYSAPVLNTLTRAFKEWTTHGYILPNPAFFTGQMLSLAPTMVATRGLKGTAEAGATLLRHPLAVGELLMRLSGGESPTFAARASERWTLKTAAGELLSMDDLEREARLGGLQDTRTSFETAESLKDVLARDGADYAALDPRRIAGGVRWWQNQIRTVAGAYDELARLSVFVSEVEKGIPPAEAAATARAAALDFRALTEWEAKYLRQIFTFYAFLRKNSDAYVKALVHNPGRVFAQMRLAQAGFSRGKLTPIEQGATTTDDMGRLVVYSSDDVVDGGGRPHPLYKTSRLTTTPMGVPEWMNTVRIFGGLGSPDAQGIASQITPLGQTLAILLMGRKLDRDFDSPLNNRIPPVLMDSFLSPVLLSTFGVGPVGLRPTDDPLTEDDDATRELGAGVPAVWAAGGDRSLTPEEQASARSRWQAFLTWFARPIGTAQQLSEGMGGIPILRDILPVEPPPPYMTQSESTMAALLGLRWRPVLDQSEAARRGETQREYRFRDAQDSVTLPGEKRSR